MSRAEVTRFAYPRLRRGKRNNEGQRNFISFYFQRLRLRFPDAIASVDPTRRPIGTPAAPAATSAATSAGRIAAQPPAASWQNGVAAALPVEHKVVVDTLPGAAANRRSPKPTRSSSRGATPGPVYGPERNHARLARLCDIMPLCGLSLVWS